MTLRRFSSRIEQLDKVFLANARMLYAERPTITYSPLAGHEFSQQTVNTYTS